VGSTYQFKVIPVVCDREQAARIKRLLELAKESTLLEAHGGDYYDESDGTMRIMLDGGALPMDRRRESFAFSEIAVERILSHVLGPQSTRGVPSAG
jgi:hypothetical protein